jgi:hypothetical protein
MVSEWCGPLVALEASGKCRVSFVNAVEVAENVGVVMATDRVEETTNYFPFSCLTLTLLPLLIPPTSN